MGPSRRGYVLIVVLLALALCSALAGSYAVAARQGVVSARMDIDRARALVAARGACIQAAKDVSIGLGRARPAGAARASAAGGAAAAPQGPVSTKIEGLPEFPPELADAGGFLGIIARRMEQARGARGEAVEQTPEEAPAPTPEGPGVRPADGAPEPAPLVTTGLGLIMLDGVPVEVSLEAETGKININDAPRWMLRDLMVAVGLKPDEALRHIEILSDAALSRLAPGSPAWQVAAKGTLASPLPGAGFERLEDILLIPSFPTELYERLAPHLTVYGQGVVDPNYATAEVLFALGVRNEWMVARVLENQRNGVRITYSSMRTILGEALNSDVAHLLAYDVVPVFTVRARSVAGRSVGRYLLRVGMGEEGRPQMLESREGWL